MAQHPPPPPQTTCTIKKENSALSNMCFNAQAMWFNDPTLFSHRTNGEERWSVCVIRNALIGANMGKWISDAEREKQNRKNWFKCFWKIDCATAIQAKWVGKRECDVIVINECQPTQWHMLYKYIYTNNNDNGYAFMHKAPPDNINKWNSGSSR